MSDQSLPQIQQRLREFRDVREWRQFHTLPNLAAAISVEAGELLDHFRWSPPVDGLEILERKRAAIEAELADVVIQCLNFADAAGIEPLAAVTRKIEENERKYPVETARG